MSDKPRIEPAMTPGEWAEFQRALATARNTGGQAVTIFELHGQRFGEIIAQANAMLADDDPRKITAERVRLLRWAADDVLGGPFAKREPTHVPVLAEALLTFAAALESYLPPELVEPEHTKLHPGTHPGLTPELERKLNDRL